MVTVSKTADQILSIFLVVASAIMLFSVSTTYGDTNDSLVVSLVSSEYTWAHKYSNQSCLFEIHPQDNYSINSVSFKVIAADGSYILGTSSTYVEGVQNETDWLLWRTPSTFNLSQDNYTCIARVVQNTYPGTTENISNATIYPISKRGLPGCAGSPDCNITTQTILPSGGDYLHRNIIIKANLKTESHLNLSIADTLNITSAGAIILDTDSDQYELRIVAKDFENNGSISGNGIAGTSTVGGFCTGCTYGDNGSNGANISISAETFNNTGSINLQGGNGGSSSAGCSHYGNICGITAICCNATEGGDGGRIYLNISTPDVYNTGTINLKGGSGGDGVGCCDYGTCAANPASGGNGGNITIIAYDLKSSGSIYLSGGDGGDGAMGCTPYVCSGGADGGDGGNSSSLVYNELNITGYLSSPGGSAGSGAGSCGGGSAGVSGHHNITYCSVLAGHEWTKITPTATNYSGSCYSRPVVNISAPNSSTSNITILLQNFTSQFNGSSGYYDAFEIWLSQDNGSTWRRYTPTENSTNAPTYTDSSYNFTTHRLANSTTNLVGVRTYNSTTKLYSEFTESDTFNTTLIPTSLSQASEPSGTTETTAISFYCNYTNLSTDEPIRSPTAYIQLDSNVYPMTYNNTTSNFHYYNTNTTWEAGNHTWRCLFAKADYEPQNGTNTTIELTGFGIEYASSKTNVSIVCPFPTIYNIIPAGQKAGIGIIRILHYNTTVLSNYSILLNNSLPVGVNVYGRCDQFVSGSSLSGWTLLSTTEPFECWQNVNTTNDSAYIWLKSNCIGAIPGAYVPFNYIIYDSSDRYER